MSTTSVRSDSSIANFHPEVLHPRPGKSSTKPIFPPKWLKVQAPRRSSPPTPEEKKAFEYAKAVDTGYPYACLTNAYLEHKGYWQKDVQKYGEHLREVLATMTSAGAERNVFDQRRVYLYPKEVMAVDGADELRLRERYGDESYTATRSPNTYVTVQQAAKATNAFFKQGANRMGLPVDLTTITSKKNESLKDYAAIIFSVTLEDPSYQDWAYLPTPGIAEDHGNVVLIHLQDAPYGNYWKKHDMFVFEPWANDIEDVRVTVPSIHFALPLAVTALADSFGVTTIRRIHGTQGSLDSCGAVCLGFIGRVIVNRY